MVDMDQDWMMDDDRVHHYEVHCEKRGCRPVVVLDPADGVQMGQLVEELLRHGYKFDGTMSADVVKALTALRTPKLAEPTRFGAIVRTGEEMRYVRTGGPERNRPWKREGYPTYRGWDEIGATEILFEGLP